MGKVTKKVLLAAWTAVFCMAACMILGFLYDRIFWAGAAISLGTYAMIGVRRLRCPHCGGGETLDRLTFATRNVYHCRHCGQRISIE